MTINECASNPCQNNGVCISGVDSYTCKCQAGYSGVNCQFNIDDCAAAPCKNGGTCVDGLRSYSCQCPKGYTGANCEYAIDWCVGQPCRRGGTCVSSFTGYRCLCKPTYYGCRCTRGTPHNQGHDYNPFLTSVTVLCKRCHKIRRTSSIVIQTV